MVDIIDVDDFVPDIEEIKPPISSIKRKVSFIVLSSDDEAETQRHTDIRSSQRKFTQGSSSSSVYGRVNVKHEQSTSSHTLVSTPRNQANAAAFSHKESHKRPRVAEPTGRPVTERIAQTRETHIQQSSSTHRVSIDASYRLKRRCSTSPIEDVDTVLSQRGSAELKRRRTDLYPALSDDEDKYDYVHAGMDLHNEQNWKPAPRPLWVKDEVHEQLLPSMDRLELDDTENKSETKALDAGRAWLRKIPVKEMSVQPHSSSRVYRTSSIPRLWTLSAMHPQIRDIIPCASSTIRRSRPLESLPRSRTSLFARLNMHTLKLVQQYKETSGCVTKIAQGPGALAVACAASGGEPESRSEPLADPAIPDPYNRDGNLLVWWQGGNALKPKAHEVRWTGRRPNDAAGNPDGVGDRMEDFHKVYTVNDIAFDPLDPKTMVSSGNDLIVRVWELRKKPDGGTEMQEPLQLCYKNVPNDVAYKPNSSVLAVACFDGTIHIHPRLSESERFTIQVTSDSSEVTQKTGAIAWGADNMLFASSESSEGRACQHLAYDYTMLRKPKYKFSTTECGDALALDAALERLALITSTKTSHTLRLYDVARHNGRRPIHKLSLEPSRREDLEVNCASFSPDGILLALGRNDHLTHVYDTRFMDKLLYTFRNNGENRNIEGHQDYGVVNATWVEAPGKVGGMGLVTAGTDGCVRLWDTARGIDDVGNGKIVVQVDHDIACMSLGDPFKGEHRLVVGDCGGWIYVYD